MLKKAKMPMEKMNVPSPTNEVTVELPVIEALLIDILREVNLTTEYINQIYTQVYEDSINIPKLEITEPYLREILSDIKEIMMRNNDYTSNLVNAFRSTFGNIKSLK